mmetsp:Transcript_11951/g.33735  ORF Transcript_11951/g.33735 Transcript_11951/m.33735 type:complete len:156 (-) Transcript_11951:801-1268(-)
MYSKLPDLTRSSAEAQPSALPQPAMTWHVLNDVRILAANDSGGTGSTAPSKSMADAKLGPDNPPALRYTGSGGFLRLLSLEEAELLIPVVAGMECKQEKHHRDAPAGRVCPTALLMASAIRGWFKTERSFFVGGCAKPGFLVNVRHLMRKPTGLS